VKKEEIINQKLQVKIKFHIAKDADVLLQKIVEKNFVVIFIARNVMMIN